MTTIIGGPETGLLDASFAKLDRDDRASKSTTGHGEEILVNVSNGNLLLTQRDAFLPSRGDDYQLVRTYNSRGRPSDASQNEDARWTSTTSIHLKAVNSSGEKRFEVEYGDGSLFVYRLDAATGLYVSTDGAGAYETLHDLNAKGNAPVYYVVTRADQTKLSFDKQGNLVSWVDPNGVRMEYSYQSNRLVKVKDDDGHVINYNYADEILVSITDENQGVLVKYRYSDERLAEVEDREGHVTRYFYTDDGFVNRILLPHEPGEQVREIRFEYAQVNWSSDGAGKSTVMTKMTDAEGNITLFDYDFNIGQSNTYLGGATTVTDAKGAKLTYEYDAKGYITRVIDQQGFATSYEYDPDGNLLAITDRRNNTSSFTYDNRGNLLSSTDNSGNNTTYTYNEFNKLTTVQTAQGAENAAKPTELFYDAKQNLIKKIDPSGDVSRFYYDQYGNLTRSIVFLGANQDPNPDPDQIAPELQQVTQYFYDLFGNNIQTIDPEGHITRSSYDHFGNLLQTIAEPDPGDPNGVAQITNYTYDKDNRLLSVTDPEGHTTTSTYDSVGNRISFKDARNKVTTYIYDRNNQLLATIDPASDPANTRATIRVYDVVGNETEITDAEGRTTTYTYNARRELVEIKTASVADETGSGNTQYTTTFAYDNEGNRIRTTDARGNDTLVSYTETGLVLEETNAVGQVTRYSYDRNLNVLAIAAGMQLAATNKRQVISFLYDDEDQVIQVTDAEGHKTTYSYDAPGTIAAVIDGNLKETKFEYDRNNRLVREIFPEVLDKDGNPVNYVVEHKFDAFGNEVETIDENGHSTTYRFDRDDRKIEIKDANDVTTTFEFDANDNVTRTTIDGPGNDEPQVTRFVYDEFDQLIAEVDGVGNALATSDLPLYQKVRQQLGFAEQIADLGPGDADALRDLYTTTYTYDRVGNKTSATDNEGRLTEFAYDNLDRLVERTDAFTNTRRYRYDGNGNLVASIDERDKLTEYSYDAHNRLLSIKNPLDEVSKFEYDTFDNITTTRDAADSPVERTTIFEYDRRNLLVKEFESADLIRNTTYDYDAVGNRIAVTDARNNKTDYIYDALNRNIEIIDRRDLSTKFVYDGVGNQLRIIDPRGGVTEFKFDPGNRRIGFVDAEGRETSYQYDALGNQIVQTTALGTAGPGSLGEEVTLFEYDAENNLRKITDSKNESTSFDFDRVYNEVAVTDARGNTTHTRFDALNRVIEIENAKLDTRTFTYDAAGNVLTQKDEKDRTTTYSYDDNNQLLVVKGPDDVETHYQSDAFGAVVAITRAANDALLASTRHFEYDKYGNLVKEYDPALGGPSAPSTLVVAGVGFKTYEYDNNNNVIAQTDQNNNTTNYEYDEDNQLTKIIDPLATNQPVRAETSFAYDGNGNRTTVEDAEGNVTKFYFNANNELVLVVDALGYSTSSAYDANGNLIATTQHATPVAVPVGPGDVPPAVAADPVNDRTVLFTYDELNRLVKRTDALGFHQEYEYDVVGNLKKIKVQTQKPATGVPEEFNTTRYDYDELDRRIRMTDDNGDFEQYGYDKVGNKISDQDKNGHVTTFDYDVNDRLLKRTDPEGGIQEFEYDAVGNLKREKDENDVYSHYEYDELDRVVKSTDNLGKFISYEYDLVGNQTAVIDENSNRTENTYDQLNRLIQVKDAEDGLIEYFYDKVGNETRRVEENLAETHFEYDKLNRLKERQDSEDGVLIITYDGFGSQLSKKDESGVLTRYAYDRNNRLQTIIDADNETIVIAYDGAGNEISREDQRGFVTHYEYDTLNRRTRTTDPLGGEKTTTYDPVGNVIAFEDQRVNSFHVEYDKNNRRTAVLTKEGYLTTFTYDKAGNETFVREYDAIYPLNANGSIPAPNSADTPRVTENTYNQLNQLAEQKAPGGLVTKYEYDDAGNLLFAKQNSLSNPSVFVDRERVSYNKNNQVVTREDANGVVTKLVLDKKGNTTEKIEAFGTSEERSTVYTYDKLNRLETETNELGTSISYSYDESDRLIRRETSADSSVGLGPRIESFEYDDNGRLALEVNGAGARTTYQYDAAGNLVLVTYAEGTQHEYTNQFFYDANGRLQAEVDGEGVRTEYDYDARGNKIQTEQGVGSGEQARITGYEYDDQDRLIAITNPEGHTTRYYYDAKGNQNIIEDPNGTLTVNTFDDDGRILTNTIGEGAVTVLADGSATATISSDFGGVRTENTYDLRGNVLSTTVGYANDYPGGSDLRVTSYEYDALDQLKKIIDPEGFSSTFSYDVFGNQTGVTIGLYELVSGDSGFDQAKADRAHPQTTTFEYDEADQLIRTLDGNGNAAINAYDLQGNQISLTTGVATANSTDIEHLSTTTYRYDSDGKLIRKETAAGGLVLITRNVLGQQELIRTLQSGTEFSGTWVVERTEYDSFGRVTAEFDSSDVKTAYEYDAVGNLVTLTRDAGGADERITQFRYDANSNLTLRIEPEGGQAAFQYDKLGNLLKTTDAEGGISRSYYDEYSQLIASVDAENYFTEFERDVVGNVLTTRIYAQALATIPSNGVPLPVATAGEDRVVHQTFDKNNKRTSETAANGSVKLYAYDSAGLLRSQTEQAATDTAALGRTVDLTDKVLSWDWDSVGRLTGFTNVDGVTETYTYDAAGNRLSETIHNPTTLATGGAEPDSVTSYTYDANNRVTSQTKGAFSETLTYDKAGNIVAKTGANGNGVTTIYDTNNRVTFITNALAQTIEYHYDRVGNLTQTVDAKGYVNQLIYDLNDRVTEEIGPQTDLYSVAAGESRNSAVVVNTYDAVGNLIQRTDASGFILTRWYDDRNQIVAEVDGDGALRKYTYNAFGQVETTLTDKTRITTTPSVTDPVPTTSPDFVVITNHFDVMGNIIQTDLPSVDTTALMGSGSNITSDVTPNAAIRNFSYFDAWGNLVESVDGMGNSSFSFADARGRQIALVDAAGYLIETFYDSQGNVVKQVKYENPIFGTTAGTLPSPPTGAANAVEKFYDAQGRLIREVSAPVQVYDYSAYGNTTTGAAVDARVATTFTYDSADNLKTKTLAEGTSQQQTEYYFYNAINQRTEVVTSDGVLATFAYDANGNLTEQRRYVNRVTVPATSAPTTPASNAGDQAKLFAYNEVNLLRTETTVVSGGNIITEYDYDASGNMTRKVEDSTGEAITSELGYDAAGRINFTITPNGAQSFVEYNVFGLKTRAWTGGDPNASAPAVVSGSIDASLTGGQASALTVTWDPLSSTAGLTTWVAWDITSRAGATAPDLASSVPGIDRTGNPNSGYTFGSVASADDVSASIPLADLAAGSTVYFRVMVRDSLGNVSWSEERSVEVPTYVSRAFVRQTGTSTYAVEAEFNGAVSAPKLLHNASAGIPMTQVGSSNRYTATLNGVDPLNDLVGFQWQYSGDTYASTQTKLLSGATNPREGNEGWVLWTLPSQDAALIGATQLVVFDGLARAPTESLRSNGTLQQELAVAATVANYDVYYGDRAAENHTLSVSYQDSQNLQVTDVVVTNTGTAQSPVYQTTWKEQYVSDANTTIATTIAVDLEAAEVSRINGQMMLGYRTVTVPFTDSAFTTASMSGPASGDVFTSSVLELAAGTNVDLKVYYIDTDGHEVIVELRRVFIPGEAANGPLESKGPIAGNVPNPPPTQPLTRTVALTAPTFAAGQSLVVLASERDGSITGSVGSRVFTAGRYSGPVDASALTTDLAPSATSGAAGESRTGDLPVGQKPFYTEIEYNDLGIKIKSNENDGLWRAYGVDANGNVVATRLLGDDRNASTSIDSFARFDARNLEIETVSPVVNGTAAVTVMTYDYASRIKSIQDPGLPAANARVYTYDGTGNLIAEEDALNGISNYFYDRLGNLVRTVDQVGDTEVFQYTYTGNDANRLLETWYDGLKSTTKIAYSYDSFGRRVSMTKGSSETTTVTYDQRNRITTVTDALSNVTRYWYDNRDNQVLVEDAAGNFFGRAYNAMGFVTHEYSFSATPANDSVARAKIAANDPTLVVQETQYDIYNNKSRTIGPEGEKVFTYGAFARLMSAGNETYEYDDYGRQSREYVSGSKDIGREYDAAGRLTKVEDTGWAGSSGPAVVTDYSYDVAGNRQAEILTIDGVTRRSQTYTYNNKNELTSWTDSAVSGAGNTESYQYYADGNLRSVANLNGTATYVFDAADRIASVTGGPDPTSFTYNSVGRRATEGSTTYSYLNNGWLDTATSGGTTYQWSYDKVGNVDTIREDGVVKTDNDYDSTYRVIRSVSGDQTTVTTYNQSGRTEQTQVTDSGNTFTYTYSYDSEGRETGVTGGGGGDGAKGSSSSSYDRNGRLSRVDLGAGDDASATTFRTFEYDNDGKIVRAVSDGAEGGTFNYLYANGKPVGEYEGSSADVGATTKLNEGNYATLREISSGIGTLPSAFPPSSIIQHTVTAGDTLRSIADQYYGSPDLWFVIADANGLTGKESLQVGSRLIVPNSVENAYHTAETHPLYKEGEIVGSTLPNLKTPPPPKKKDDECAKITAIILVVVVAIAAIALTVVTVGAAAPAAVAAIAGASAGLAATIAISVAVGVVVGAAIAFAASVITQSILVGFGLQEKFDWEAVAADTVAGAFGGAAAGLGSAVATARTVTTLVRVSNIVGQVALETAGEAASQAIQNDGQVTNPWLVVAAGAGGGLGAVGDIGRRGLKVAGEAGSVVTLGSDLGTDVSKVTTRALGSVDEVASVARAAGKGKLGVFKDVFFSQLRPGKFTQSVAKGGIADLADGKKLIRTVETAKDGVKTVTFKTVDRLSEVGTSRTARLQSALESAGKAITEAPGKLKQSISDFAKSSQQSFTEFRRAGRVKELDLPGNVKTVRSFETAADGRRVEKLNVVFRQSYLGTSRTARLSNAASSVSQAAGSKLAAAKRAIAEAPGNISQSFTEFRRAGRVKELDLPGNVKTVRTFETAADGTRVEKLNVVFRQSYLGTSKSARLRNAASALEDAVGSRLSAAGTRLNAALKSASEAPGKLKQAIYESYRSGRVKELDLPGNVKTVRTFETAADGKRVEKLSVVFRQSYLGTSKSARFKSFVSTARTAVAEAASPLLAKGKAIIKREFVEEFGGSIRPFSAAGANFYGDKGELAVNLLADNFLRTDKEQESLYKQIGTRQFQTGIGKAFLFSRPVLPYFSSVARGEVYSYSEFVDTVEAGGSTEKQPPRTFIDSNALATFSNLHARQHNYLTLEWRAVAGNTTTQILSPFAIDRAASVDTLVTANRLVSGQVWDFDQESFVTYAEGSAGGVGGNPNKTPDLFS